MIVKFRHLGYVRLKRLKFDIVDRTKHFKFDKKLNRNLKINLLDFNNNIKIFFIVLIFFYILKKLILNHVTVDIKLSWNR